MKLISATIRNYRIHRETTIRFDEQRSLIGGVNESGKSTLIEAIHRGLFLKSRVTGDTQKSMMSLHHAGHPEVEIEFSVAGKIFRVNKRFSGQSGMTQLVEVGGNVWHGEEAESQLNTLLKVDDKGGGRGLTERIMQQWAHLWVWQGRSGNDPTRDAASEHNAILQRLQHEGSATIMQSDRDSHVAAYFARQYEQVFTQNGKFRAGSEANEAEKACIEAEEKERMCKERMQRLEQAILDFERSEQTIAEADAELSQLEQQKKKIESNIEQAKQLQSLKNQQIDTYTREEQQEKELQQANQAILDLRGEINKRTAELAPKRDESRRLQLKLTELKRQVIQASETYHSTIEKARTIRQQYDLAQLWVARFEFQDHYDTLSTNFHKVNQQRNEILQYQEALNKLPFIDENALQSLRKVQEQLSEAQAALKAMAVGIEVIAAEHVIRVGQEDAKAGNSFHLSGPTDIWLDNLTHLRIQPGGGGSLETTRQQVQTLQKQLNSTLDSYAIESFEQAATILANRNQIEQKISTLHCSLKILDDGKLNEDYYHIKDKLIKVTAEINRRTEQFPEYTAPATRSEAATYLDNLRHKLQQADTEELETKAGHDILVKQFNQTELDFQIVISDLATNDQQITEKQARLNLVLEMYGDDIHRTKGLQQVQSAKQQTKVLLEQICKSLEALQPEQIERDQMRIERALATQEKDRQAAIVQRAVSQAALRLDGSEDPQAAWSMAHARLQNAREHFTHVKRKAEAIKLLHQLFQEQQKQLSDRFSQPLADKISAYLQGLYGAGTKVSITMDEGIFRDIQLIRPSDTVSLSFDSLSGGTREQVAAAVRLAMAEFLAANHDGKLPIVFDDAFAYSDPERVKTLQRMLDLAAERGLQVIILSCNPADYAGLGAQLTRLDGCS
ncbi:AAA family ATPase [Nitrosomonas communis]|uniref:DNA repair exonuclease SbcCD ATPase subunit n=1 Tax=Nitrosomonas communis TaxID=44574 RepID=A0A1I4NU13_9PROT|nr:AAA family ATPase [Nitrosomonas communis]SFM18969.1 DNA repair exonuclease SbcCD ATPase subunit [Nitrosomonas communis]